MRARNEFSADARRPRWTTVLALVTCLGVLTGCAGAGGAAQEADESGAEPGAGAQGEQPQSGNPAEEPVRGEQPGWVENVFPPPRSKAASVNEVQITHTNIGDNEGVRLKLDGVDVTTFSEPRAGVLTYDPNQSRAPVELDSGRHRATAVRVRLDEAGQPHEVVDRFEWQFTVL